MGFNLLLQITDVLISSFPLMCMYGNQSSLTLPIGLSRGLITWTISDINMQSASLNKLSFCPMYL